MEHSSVENYTRGSPCTTNISCFASPLTEALIENRRNFEKSGLPSRVLYLCGGDNWVDLPVEIVERFDRGASTARVEINGRDCIVELQRMLIVGVMGGCYRSVAWIDEDGRCFFPKRVFDCGCGWGRSRIGKRPRVPDLNA